MSAASDAAAWKALETVASITERFPSFAPLLGIPEIASLLIKASEPGSAYSGDKLLAELKNTNWWKTNSESSRQWAFTKVVDPAQAAQSQAQVATDILHAAANAGITLTPAQVALLAEGSVQGAWTAAQLQEKIGAQANEKNLKAGTMRADAIRLRGIAADYGVPLSDHTAFAWAQKINQGKATSDGFQSYAVQQAKLHFPTLAEQLDQGMTVRQLADPYLQIAGQKLGIDPNRMDISEPKWASALQHRDEKGNIVGPMTTLDWERKIMENPVYQWDRTADAQAAASNLVQELGSAFGVLA